MTAVELPLAACLALGAIVAGGTVRGYREGLLPRSVVVQVLSVLAVVTT